MLEVDRNDVDLMEDSMPHWWAVHQVLRNWKEEHELDLEKAPRVEDLLYDHISPKVRLEQCRYFADAVEELRQEGNAGAAVRRYVEAFVFLCRSSLDCEAYFLNAALGLELEDFDCNVFAVQTALRTNDEFAGVHDAFSRGTDSGHGTWFWHLNRLRNVATHRMVSASANVLRVGSGPTHPTADLFFLPDDPEERRGFSGSPILGCGAYTSRVLGKSLAFVEDVEKELLSCLDQSRAGLRGPTA